MKEYVKFRFEWVSKKLPESPEIRNAAEELISYTKAGSSSGLFEIHPFTTVSNGNISTWIADGFVITASQTNKYNPTPEDVDYVVGCNPLKNRIRFYGSRKPSSESWAHIFAYLFTDAKAVFHPHEFKPYLDFMPKEIEEKYKFTRTRSLRGIGGTIDMGWPLIEVLTLDNIVIMTDHYGLSEEYIGVMAIGKDPKEVLRRIICSHRDLVDYYSHFIQYPANLSKRILSWARA